MRRDGRGEGRRPAVRKMLTGLSFHQRMNIEYEQGISNDEVFLGVSCAVRMFTRKIGASWAFLDGHGLHFPSTFCGSLFDIRYSFFNMSQHVRGDGADAPPSARRPGP